MVARLNVTKARLYPEELPESIAVTAATSGTSIASYSAFSPYALFLRKLWTSQVPGVTLRVDNDSGHATLESPQVSRPARLPVDIDLISNDSLDLWAVGSAYESYYTYTLRVTKLTVFEKIKYGIPLSDDEVSLEKEFDIKKKFKAGILRSLDIPQFKKVIEVAKEVTVAAAGNTRVGRMINVKSGEKAVLIGISVDRDFVTSDFGGPGVNDTYFTVNRDVIDTAHVKLDCAAMPSLDNEVSCYVPATDRLEIIIESTTGVTSLPVRYRYGVAELSLLEKLKWEKSLTKEEQDIVSEFGLQKAVRAGVL